jgi:hypothetical protein
LTGKGDEGSEPIEGRGSDPADPPQCRQRAERTEGIPVSYDAPRQRWTHPGETIDLGLRRLVQIDPGGGKCRLVRFATGDRIGGEPAGAPPRIRIDARAGGREAERVRRWGYAHDTSHIFHASIALF